MDPARLRPSRHSQGWSRRLPAGATGATWRGVHGTAQVVARRPRQRHTQHGTARGAPQEGHPGSQPDHRDRCHRQDAQSPGCSFLMPAWNSGTSSTLDQNADSLSPPGRLPGGESCGVAGSCCVLPCRANAVTAGHPPTRPVEPRSAGDPGQDRRAISVQLATVPRGQSRVLAVPAPGWSAGLAARIGRIPKLIVRVRFSSPAPGASLQVSAPSARRDPFALLSRLLIFRRERVTGWPRSWNCGPSAPIDHRVLPGNLLTATPYRAASPGGTIGDGGGLGYRRARDRDA